MSDAASEHRPTTWHEGEKALQSAYGVAGRMEEIGPHIIRDAMPDQHRIFYAQLPFLVAGSVDPRGDAWATLLAGHPGFVRSLTPTTLEIAARRDSGDPASEGMQAGEAIGLLGIELHTRRRNRVNGLLDHVSEDALGFTVDQSFGNCPKYIQRRDFAFVRDPGLLRTTQREESDRIGPEERAMIEAADTFFVASYADRENRRQVDVSHRGGRPGFVRVDDDGLLTIPDFSGNLFFNTLGNILLNGRAGLVFVDFETGDLLQMTGDAEIDLRSPEIALFEGAERLWRFRPRKIVLRRDALPLRWTFEAGGWSPFSLQTGDWAQAARARMIVSHIPARMVPRPIRRS
ncbi:hypothetical protein HL653_20640 [Sphingomonas sp. AP4-R1]|uniref:pyridoxamine 5'-phosphate oxidase family protein n=1 Tax=Sphingomonas sp. AP4-R1 TaxID=2735134 RepID=UPI00149399D2|nr:pyridoxamine 5'-phosphate oxidase family protein [Sphingomonas sp. AP4-R1]QJU59837.1 hypothetical protein HL653_20640 [Sphingomonas sp. AP4-R1]